MTSERDYLIGDRETESSEIPKEQRECGNLIEYTYHHIELDKRQTLTVNSHQHAINILRKHYIKEENWISYMDKDGLTVFKGKDGVVFATMKLEKIWKPTNRGG